MTELTNAQKRVQIARDVIEQLNAEKIVSHPGIYFGNLDPGLTEGEITGDTQVRTVLEAQPSCQVCALGACFVSMMKRYNECTIDGLLGDGYPDSTTYARRILFGMTSDRLSEYLNRLFSEEQIELIETAYEGLETAGTTGDLYNIPEDSPLLLAHEFHMARAKYEYEKEVYYSQDEIELEIGEGREDDGNVILKDIMKNIIRNKGLFKP